MTRLTEPVPPPDRPWVRPWPDPVAGPFHLRVWFERVDGVQAIVGVELWGRPPHGDWAAAEALPRTPIRAADIRLPLGEMRDWWCEVQAARARAARSVWEALPDGEGVPREQHERAVETFEQRVSSKHTRRGRPPLDDAKLRAVAEVYNSAVHTRRPTQAVFEAFPELRTYKTAQRWVSAARKRGIPLLPVPQARSDQPNKKEDQ